MLYEIQNPKQFENEGFRRWFTDDSFDLIVWYTDDQLLEGFQLCYDKGAREKCLSWRKSGTYTHTGVDDGEVYGQNKMSPILVADGVFDKWTVAKAFKAAGKEIDPKVSAFVYRKLIEFGGI